MEYVDLQPEQITVVSDGFVGSWTEFYESEAHVENLKRSSVEVTIEISATFADVVRKAIEGNRVLRVWYLPGLTNATQTAEEVEIL